MEKKLFIHIGSHKTGTSSIQRFLFENKLYLSQSDYVYFDQHHDGGRDSTAGTWINTENTRYTEPRIKNIERLARKLGNLQENNVVISSEMFSWLFHADELKRFRMLLNNYFNEIKVIAYLRRQDLQLISHHQQGSKGPVPASYFYGNEETALPTYSKHFDKYLDYNSRIGIWGDAFEDENIIIRVFEKEKLAKGDAVIDFFKQIGLNLLETNQNINIPRVNESNGFIKTKVGHLMNQSLDNDYLSFVIREKLSNTGKMMPKRNEAKFILDKYLESNINLNKRFRVSSSDPLFNDSFSMFDESCDAWSEQTANNAIKDILIALNSMSIRQFIIFKMRKHIIKSKLFYIYRKFFIKTNG